MQFSSIFFSFFLFNTIFSQFSTNLRQENSSLGPNSADEFPEMNEIDLSYYFLYFLLVNLLLVGTSTIVLIFMNYKEEDIPQSYTRAI